MKGLLILIVLSFSVQCSAQGPELPYRHVDSIMRSYKEKIRSVDDLYKVIYFIRSQFTEDSLRLRASFIWITDNIAYDVVAFRKEDASASKLDYVIKHKKAICSGYAALLKYFCDAFLIECVIVQGKARGGFRRDINLTNSTLRPDHAWNAVKINNEWKLIDATWAAGIGIPKGEDETDLVFKKEFNNAYYFTQPDRFILNHFPRETKYQLISKPVSEKEFRRNPLFTSEFIKENITKVSPDSSVIKFRIGDTLVIKFKTEKNIMSFCAASDVLKKAEFAGYSKRSGEWLEFHYPVNATGYYNLYISDCANNLVLIAYKLEVQGKNN